MHSFTLIQKLGAYAEIITAFLFISLSTRSHHTTISIYIAIKAGHNDGLALLVHCPVCWHGNHTAFD